MFSNLFDKNQDQLIMSLESFVFKQGVAAMRIEGMVPYQKLRFAAVLFLFIFSAFPYFDGYRFFGAGLFLLAVGGLLNTLVIGVNGKLMPVLKYKNHTEMPEKLRDTFPNECVWQMRGDMKEQVLFDNSVRLKFLADRFRFFNDAYSIGDFVSYFGIFISLGEIFMH